MNNPQKILIVRTDRIGDVVLSLPMASVIKKYLPASSISFLLSGYTKELASSNKYINSILILKKKNGKIAFWENIKLIRNQKFDLCFVVYPTFKIALILFLAGIENRIGSGYRWYSFLFNGRIYEHRKNGRQHELEYNIKMLQKIGIDEKVNKNNVDFGIYPQEKRIEDVNNKLIDFKIDPQDTFIIIHPGSGGSSVDLPPKKLKEIIHHININYKVKILLTGSKEERESSNQFLLSEQNINVGGIFDLGELIALINKSKLLMANSTGPIHIAAALGIPVIGFYPKINSCSPVRWGPFSSKSFIFTPQIDCSNCNRKQCSQLNCMDTIDLELLYEKIKILLI